MYCSVVYVLSLSHKLRLFSSLHFMGVVKIGQKKDDENQISLLLKMHKKNILIKIYDKKSSIRIILLRSPIEESQ